MAEKWSKVAFGSRENISTAVENGAIDEYDLLFLDNGETGWIDKDGETVIATPRTQEAIVVNGVTGLGLANGDSVPAGASLDDVVKMLIQKAVPATYTKPTIAIANNGGQASGGVEAGTSITPKLKATFTKNDAGNLTAISIKQGSTDVVTGTTSPLTYDGSAVVIGDETLTFSASATYGDAPVKNNNLGQESKENWFAGDTIASSDYSITGQRNGFYGCGVGTVSEITSDLVRGLANKKLNLAQDNTFTINVAVGQQYVLIAYKSTIRDINKVHYVEGNDPNLAANFTKTLVQVADARGGENGLMEYKAFLLQLSTPAQATMTLNVTI